MHLFSTLVPLWGPKAVYPVLALNRAFLGFGVGGKCKFRMLCMGKYAREFK